MTTSRKDEECPECGTLGYLILPSRRNCQTCLRLRAEFLDAVFDHQRQGQPGMYRRPDGTIVIAD